LATWQVIEFASQTLVRLLERQLAVLLPGNNVDVQVATIALFEQFATTDRATITLFLYRIIENPEMRNSPPRVLSDGTQVRQPLPLELCYLVTPWSVRKQETPDVDAVATQEEHRLLGAVLQTFYDHAELTRSDLSEDGAAMPVWSPIDTVQVVLDSASTYEDVLRIFDSAELSYRMSLTYRVRVLGMEPGETLRGARVVDATFTSGNV